MYKQYFWPNFRWFTSLMEMENGAKSAICSFSPTLCETNETLLNKSLSEGYFE